MFIIDSVAKHIQGFRYKRCVFDGIDFKNGQGAVSTFKSFIATDQERSKQRKIQCSKSRNWKTIKLS